jgi:hypothetical protein
MHNVVSVGSQWNAYALCNVNRWRKEEYNRPSQGVNATEIRVFQSICRIMQNISANKRERFYFQFAERNSKLNHKCEPSYQGDLVVSLCKKDAVHGCPGGPKIPTCETQRSQLCYRLATLLSPFNSDEAHIPSVPNLRCNTIIQSMPRSRLFLVGFPYIPPSISPLLSHFDNEDEG